MAAVVPHPPLLVPELVSGAVAETAEVRAAAVAAAKRLAGAAERWIAVGADPVGRRTVPDTAAGSFRGFGVDVVVGLRGGFDRSAGDVDPEMPLPLLIAGWLAGKAGAPVRVRGELVAPDTSPAECAALGAELAAECAATPYPVALLVLGDGSSIHVGYQGRSEPFDDVVAAALRDADVEALAALDPDTATEIGAIGRAPWQVLAAATGPGWRGELLYHAAPFGVAYHVAVWTPPA